MAVWRFILADPSDGSEVGEVFQAGSRDIAIPWKGLRTVTFTLDLANPMCNPILAAASIDRVNLLLKAYRLQRDSTYKRMFVGPLVAANETADQNGGRLEVAAAGPQRRLADRLIGKSTAGYGDGTPLAMKDIGQIQAGIIVVVNAEDDTGIRVGAITASADSYYGPVYFKPAGEAIVELSATLDGPDIDYLPVEPVADIDGLHIADFTAAPAIGSVRDEAAFEFGVGRRNIASYGRPITTDGEANRAFALPAGFPDAIEAGDSTAMSEDAPTRATRGLKETVVATDVGSLPLRQQLTDEHVRIRKLPRETIVFEPAPNIGPEYGTDFDNGDLIPARAVVYGSLRFDAYFRCYGVRFLVDDQGNETPAVTLVDDQ